MRKLGLLIALLAGCSHKPCATTSDCGSGDVCSAALCQSLSCNDTWYAIDPATGACTPLSGCTDRASVATWASCSNPCAGLAENACLQAPHCQATYASTTTPLPPGAVGGVAGPQPETYRDCQPVATFTDPCSKLDASACMSDSRCASLMVSGTAPSCACDGGVCNCPAEPAPPLCALKPCSDITSTSDCNARFDCTTTPPVFFGGAGGGAFAGSQAQPRFSPASGCFPISGCVNADEKSCRAQQDCRPVYQGGKFLACEAQDFTRHCASDGDCNAGERCNSAGACVVKGCPGDNEQECNLDPTCEPLYAFKCPPGSSPYGSGGGGVPTDSGAPGGAGTAIGCVTPANGGAPVEGCGCDVGFVGCEAHGSVCDPGKSVLVRDPAILDDPFWSFARVLAAVTGSPANAVANAWLPTLGTDVTVDTKVASGRPGAAAFIAALPRDSANELDAARIGFQPTSLSNRIDLADGTSCGEARITYALAGGATDRFHRMTVIVELRQPDDGAGCHKIAQQWVALSSLSGNELETALQAIYVPLINPTNLKQIRTNEFLVGAQQGQTWQLREFHLGTDGLLHQALLPLQTDAASAQTPDFATWAQTNEAALQKGIASFPAQYRVPTATEDGAPLTVNSTDGSLATVINQSTCAGCHTQATNTAFAHVGERMQPGWRAEISQFLEQQLAPRAAHLNALAAYRANAVLDVRPLH